MRDEKVPAAELDDARRAVVADLRLSLEHSNQLLDFAEERENLQFACGLLGQLSGANFRSQCRGRATVSRKYIDPATMQIVGVGDAQKIAPVLQKYGPVSVFDAQGKPEEVKPATK